VAEGRRIVIKKTAIITGGVGGLGRAFDRALRDRGWYTVLVDLPGPALDELTAMPDRLVLPCDLTDTDAMRLLCDKVRLARPSIDLVIYNAGITQIGAFSKTPVSAHRRVFEINYFAAVEMIRLLQQDVRASKGTHLAISSVAGFSPLFRRAAYSASKHALEGFFKSLRSEEKDHGVNCLIATASFIATNIGNSQASSDGIARPGSASDGIDYMSPQKAVEIILRGYDKRRSFIPVGRIAWLSYLVYRISPSLFEKLMERKMKNR